MRISRATLERIINEELVNYLERRLFEAPELGSPLDDEMGPPPPEEGLPLPAEADGVAGDPDLGDPADDALIDDVAGNEPDGEPGSVAQEMQGKVIAKIEHVPESESIPGAQEVVLSFQDESDKLRLILTPSGNVKYFWKGLHSDIGKADEVPPEEIEQEEELSPEEEMEGMDDEMESVPLPTDAGIDDPENPEI